MYRKDVIVWVLKETREEDDVCDVAIYVIGEQEELWE